MGRTKNPKPEAPLPYHHGDLRQALVQAGIEILEDQGLAALTLRETARHAGVSHAAPYHHFADKNALMAGVAHRGFEIMRDEMASRATGAADASDGLRAYGIAYAAFAQRHPALFRLMYSQQRFTPDPEGELDRANTGVYPEMIDGICVATGCTPEEAMLVGVLLWSTMPGLAMLWLEGQLQATGADSLESLAEAVTKRLGRLLEHAQV